MDERRIAKPIAVEKDIEIITIEDFLRKQGWSIDPFYVEDENFFVSKKFKIPYKVNEHSIDYYPLVFKICDGYIEFKYMNIPFRISASELIAFAELTKRFQK